MSHGPSSDSGGAGQASDQARRWAGRPPAHHHDRTSLQHKAPSSGASEAMSHDHGSGPEATLPTNPKATNPPPSQPQVDPSQPHSEATRSSERSEAPRDRPPATMDCEAREAERASVVG